jgi:ssDNA-binding Zn-finger/Zn-ribbon topoisomerase 1
MEDLMRYNYREKNCLNCFHSLLVKENREDEGLWKCSNFEEVHFEPAPAAFTCLAWESYIKN